MAYRNGEDTVTQRQGEAVGTVANEEKKRNEAVTSLITMLMQLISLAGFELVGRIVLKDKETGKEYR